jgi:hypothetical protein
MIKMTKLLREVQESQVENQIEEFLKEYKATAIAAYVYKDGKPLLIRLQ